MKYLLPIFIGLLIGFGLAGWLPMALKHFTPASKQHADLTGIYMTRNYNGRYDIDPNWPGPFWPKA